ncbi:MAG: class I SAM-dependent methyltransferase [Verrucomicrobia bacterium]|nr:class I SAM-dependent methyltransferase [Verrucomicrobiota bacterium]MBU1908682.1 class I SAM-dependent methyltransferase [Verrucomicrobiota bacterium]
MALAAGRRTVIMSDDFKIVQGSCPSCGSSDGELILDALHDVENNIQGDYAISRCRACRLYYLSTRPDEASLPACYDQNYHVRFNRSLTPLRRALFNARYAGRLRRLRRHCGGKVPSSMLEIGCGDGSMLIYLEQVLPPSVELAGVELDASHIALPAASRIRLYEADFDRLDLDRRFDVVLMYHVLEHFAHPVENLSRICSLLNPGGLLLVQVPNWDAWWRKAFPRHWNGLQIPRHQLFLQPPTLEDLCLRSGFRTVKISGLIDPGDFAVSVCNWLTNRLRLKTLPRQAWFYMPMVILGGGVAAITNLVSDRAGELEAVARPAG